MTFAALAPPLSALLRRTRSVGVDTDGSIDLQSVHYLLVDMLSAAACLVTTASAIAPARKILGILAKGATSAAGFDDVTRLMQGVDTALGPQLGGFSRLLQSALEAGELVLPDHMDRAAITGPTRTALRAAIVLSAELDALDDLSHALSLPRDRAAACACFAATADVLVTHGGMALPTAYAALLEWAEARHVHKKLAAVLALRTHITAMPAGTQPADDVDARALFMWTLAHRLTHGRPVRGADEDAFVALAARVHVDMAEVDDLASFWEPLTDIG